MFTVLITMYIRIFFGKLHIYNSWQQSEKIYNFKKIRIHFHISGIIDMFALWI
jgi:hypothetical protein